MKFKSKYKTFHSQKCIWKYYLRIGGHFVQGGISQWFNNGLKFSQTGQHYSEWLAKDKIFWHCQSGLSNSSSLLKHRDMKKTFHITGHLYGEYKVHKWYLLTKASIICRDWMNFVEVHLNKLVKQSSSWNLWCLDAHVTLLWCTSKFSLLLPNLLTQSRPA